MHTKQEILEEIKRTAKDNDGKPLGMARFGQETGLKPYHWKKYWAKFGDAQQEAGFAPNQLQDAYTDEFLIEKVIGVINRLGKFPTYDELNLERSNDPEFPNRKVFTRLGSKQQLAQKILDYCENKHGYEKVVELSLSIIEKPDRQDDENSADNITSIGEVYLFKSGRYYKIGKTNDTVRRGTELRIQLPEKLDLIHSIKTDDPSGVETYWHKRFEAKRMNGEWFDLSAADIRAFRRWKRIY